MIIALAVLLLARHRVDEVAILAQARWRRWSERDLADVVVVAHHGVRDGVRVGGVGGLSNKWRRRNRLLLVLLGGAQVGRHRGVRHKRPVKGVVRHEGALQCGLLKAVGVAGGRVAAGGTVEERAGAAAVGVLLAAVVAAVGLPEALAARPRLLLLLLLLAARGARHLERRPQAARGRRLDGGVFWAVERVCGRAHHGSRIAWTWLFGY